MTSRFTILLLLFAVRIFLGPVTFTLESGSSTNMVEAFNHVKLHKRRASFIDLQRSSTSLFIAPGAPRFIREAAIDIPVPTGRSMVQPARYTGVKPFAVPLPEAFTPTSPGSRKEILLI